MSETPTPARSRRAPDAGATDAALPPLPNDPNVQASRRASDASGRTRLLRIVALVAIVVGAALAIWLLMRDDGNSAADAPATGATAVTPAQLENLSTSIGHPVFWLGPKADTTYELVQATNGSIYVRYLPKGAEIGTKDPYLTVATYPFEGAYAAIQAVSSENSSTAIPIAGNGLAEATGTTATSVHAAFPDLDYQVEVFDPTPGTAAALVKAGGLASVGKVDPAEAAAAEPHLATASELATLAASLDHPLYWAGTKSGSVYEVKQTSNGQVYIRYLPAGSAAGDTGQHFTVGTYPYPGALDAMKALAKEPNAQSIPLPGGGLAVIDSTSSKNIHLAYPGADVQIEVFDPSPAAARNIVASGQIKTIG